MDALAGLTFRAADQLWLLAAIPLAAVFLWLRERIRQRRANRFVSERLRGVTNQLRSARPWLLTLAFLAGLVALAGPRHGFVMRRIEMPESNRVILVDASQSMAAEDVGTSRMAAASAIAKKIIAAEEGRIALIMFEGEPEVVSPLTNDRDAVITLLESFGPGELTEPGSDVGRALRRALDLLPPGAGPTSEFVVISDGEHRGEDIAQSLEAVSAAGARIVSVLVGTSEGSTIPWEGRPLRDESGEVIVTHARADILRKIAQETGGEFFDNPFGVVPLRRLAGTVESRETGGLRAARVPVERYQWPLGLALALFLCGSIAHRGAEW